MTKLDAIVIGAGHNGLVCAATLAAAGRRVVVLESAAEVGGLAARREFHPGYFASVAHTGGRFSSQIAAELDLASHGLLDASPLTLLGLGAGGEVTLTGDGVYGAADSDNAAWAGYSDLMRRFAELLAPFWRKSIPRIAPGPLRDIGTFAQLGWRLRRMGREDMQEFLRIVTLPMRDLMDEHFEHPGLKALLCWDALLGSRFAPRSPNGAVLTLLYRLAEGGHSTALGDDLIQSLCRAAEANGADIHCGERVASVDVANSADGPRACGVTLASGQRMEADVVMAAIDPKQVFLDCVGVRHLDIGFTNRIRRFRSDGCVGKLHLALNGPPTIAGRTEPAQRMVLADDMDTIEFAWDDAKHGALPARPVLELMLPSVHDAACAPAGHHVLSAHVMYVPYALRNGWSDEARASIQARAIEAIEIHAPAIRPLIEHAEFLAPPDLEAMYGVTGGHWHHGEMALDQVLMMRPTYGAAQYATPIAGLYLASAGAHPGGDLVGAAGRNAAQVVLS